MAPHVEEDYDAEAGAEFSAHQLRSPSPSSLSPALSGECSVLFPKLPHLSLTTTISHESQTREERSADPSKTMANSKAKAGTGMIGAGEGKSFMSRLFARKTKRPTEAETEAEREGEGEGEEEEEKRREVVEEDKVEVFEGNSEEDLVPLQSQRHRGEREQQQQRDGERSLERVRIESFHSQGEAEEGEA
jgi:hypothetical protein